MPTTNAPTPFGSDYSMGNVNGLEIVAYHLEAASSTVTIETVFDGETIGGTFSLRTGAKNTWELYNPDTSASELKASLCPHVLVPTLRTHYPQSITAHYTSAYD